MPGIAETQLSLSVTVQADGEDHAVADPMEATVGTGGDDSETGAEPANEAGFLF